MRSAFIEIRSIKNLHDAEPLKKRIVQKKHREKSNCAGAKRRKDEQKTETKDTENRGKIRGWILTAMAIMAAYLVLCGVGITEMPEWGPDWYPVQICMVVIGGGWLIMFMAANGAFDEMDLYDDKDEEDEQWEE